MTLSPITTARDGAFQLPSDGFIQVMPFGEWPGAVEFGGEIPANLQNVCKDAEGRPYLPIRQILDREAADAIVAAFKPDMLLDYDHFADDPDSATRAAGWGEELQIRDDGLYCRVRWTADGLKDVSGGNYRFISPVFPFAALRNIGGDRWRPTAMSGAALTNKPRLKGIRAVSNRADAGDFLLANRDGFITVDGHPIFIGEENDTTDDLETPGPGVVEAHADVMSSTLKQYGDASSKYHRRQATDLWKKMNADQRKTYGPRISGFLQKSGAASNRDAPSAASASPCEASPMSQPAGAGAGSAADSAEEERKRKMREQLIQALGLPPEAKDEEILAAVAGLNGRVKAIEQKQLEDQVENDLKEHAAKIVNREAMKAALLKDRAGTLAVLAGVKAPETGAVLNRGDGAPPPTATVDAEGAEAAAARNRYVEEVRVANRLATRSEAWPIAARAKPELFR